MAENPTTWTGERLETFIMTENTNEHLHRYCIATEWIKGRAVLDIACGEGYGSGLLARTAAEVIGVDISKSTIEAARIKYQRSNLQFIQGAADQIPAQDNYFDVVVSFETIEHHDRHEEMMSEIKRVLKPDGVLIISSPDKRYYSDKPGYSNPFHVKELYQEQFEVLLKKHFKQTQFFKQKHITGSIILPLHGESSGNEYTKRYYGNYTEINDSELEALYIIGIASDYQFNSPAVSFFDGDLVLKSQFKELEDYVTYQVTHNVTNHVTQKVTSEVMNSRRYRIGNAIIKPLVLLKKIFNA